jgi:serine/threonine protein kinase
VGKFELLMRLGQGGMATVYLARSLGTGGFQRLVAIKLMHQFLSTDDQFVEMFLDEARVAANIRHPNCVSIVDLGNEADQLFMVMDYVEGDTLAAIEGTAARLGRAIPLGVVLRVVLDALAGLDAAHELKTPDGVDLKVVHRDVSPQNILIGVDGTARLTDFGIARAEQRIATTRTGMLKGKAPFMAPEQFEGRPVDRRADVFAMGVTLWEAIALRRLFPGRETYEQALRNTRAPYRKLKDILPSVPASLDEIVRKALAHNPNERFPTAAAFADTLEKEFRSILATSRQVGSFMAAVAADKIQRERDAVRNAPKPSDDISPRGNNRAVTRNAYGARRSEEPISATALRAFDSRPPTSANASAHPANDIGSDEDPEVAAALRLLTEVPSEQVDAALEPAVPSPPQAELPVLLVRESSTSHSLSFRPPSVEGTPLRRSPSPPKLSGEATVAPRLRAETLSLEVSRQGGTTERPRIGGACPSAGQPRNVLPGLSHAVRTRSPEITSMLTRDIGGPDVQTFPEPSVPPARHPMPSKRGLGEGEAATPIEFKLVSTKMKEALACIDAKPGQASMSALDEPSQISRGVSSEASPTLSDDIKNSIDRHVAQFPSLTPSPKGPAVLHNRWVSGAVIATVILVVLFVITRSS